VFRDCVSVVEVEELEEEYEREAQPQSGDATHWIQKGVKEIFGWFQRG
jgi:hypothetical protein